MKHIAPYRPGSTLTFNLVGVNDYKQTVTGNVLLQLMDTTGKIARQQTLRITIPAYLKTYLPVSIRLPQQEGGYLLLTQFTPDIEQNVNPVISRRYIKVGSKDVKEFYEVEIGSIK
jgi:hypothetical protein